MVITLLRVSVAAWSATPVRALYHLCLSLNLMRVNQSPSPFFMENGDDSRLIWASKNCCNAGVSGITGVEQHQNPSYECIKRGPAKWALATLEINTCNEGDKLQKDYSPHSQTSVCAVSDISCASTLKPSLI